MPERKPQAGKDPIIRRAGAALAGWIALLAAASGPAFGACALERGETGRLELAREGTALRLAGGPEIRLAALHMPDGGAGAAETARASLAALADGHEAELRYAQKRRRDRYGRAIAYVFLKEGGSERLLRAELLQQGHALVRGVAADLPCLGPLLAAETKARAARAGLWRDGFFAVAWAGDPSLLAQNGLYSLVEGRIVSVGRTKRFIYLNFGRDWSTDFTVTIAAADLGPFESDGPIERLDGARVRIRGWLTQHGGPTMRVSHPGEIEVLEGAGVGAALGN